MGCSGAHDDTGRYCQGDFCLIRPASTVLLLTVTVLPALAASPFTCTVSEIVDGDTWTCREGPRVRAWGIDAPEGSQPGGDLAARAIGDLIAGRTLTCSGSKRSYDRIVAHCILPDGTDIERAMVERGAAWDYRRYSHGAYEREEAAARAGRRGIWAGDPVAPWEWRRAQRGR